MIRGMRTGPANDRHDRSGNKNRCERFFLTLWVFLKGDAPSRYGLPKACDQSEIPQNNIQSGDIFAHNSKEVSILCKIDFFTESHLNCWLTLFLSL